MSHSATITSISPPRGAESLFSGGNPTGPFPDPFLPEMQCAYKSEFESPSLVQLPGYQYYY
eukprot:3456264-Rhodomonas_salina.1